MAERDLSAPLRTMAPVLAPGPCGFAVWLGGAMPFQPFASALAGVEIRGNVIAGVRHGDLLPCWDRPAYALRALGALARA